MSPVAPSLPSGSDALRVLVAAGDRLSLDYTAQTLEQNGFTVMRAADDASAFKTWQSDGPDVVLVDVDLPNEVGFELCRPGGFERSSVVTPASQRRLGRRIRR